MENSFCKTSDSRPIQVKQECLGSYSGVGSPMESSVFSSSVSSTSSLSSSPSHNFILRNTSQLYVSPLTNNESLHTSSLGKSMDHFSHSTSAVDTFLDSSMSDDQEAQLSINHPINTSNIRVNRFFPDGVVDILSKWFYENQSYPYPDENMTNYLAREASISAKQVRKWFANKRVRSNKCFKQTSRIKKEPNTDQVRRKTVNKNNLFYNIIRKFS